MTDADTSQRIIAFSPPDITEEEIAEVADALRSGWITTGPRTKQLERKLKEFTGAAGFACLGSATAALECVLRILGIGPGDEVVTSAYTYTASVSPICHVGATPIMCDVEPGTYHMDIDAVRAAITDKTKAIIPVDLGGCMFDYDRLYDALEAVKDTWHPVNELQSCFDRCIVIADAAHALGASYHGKPCGSVADFTAFSFHAVKNFTTAEGGGLAWIDAGFDNDDFYHQVMLQSLHGQSKDALAKTKVGAWEYDVEFPGYKCNMTDMQAALGLVQLRRYPALLARRRAMAARYESNLADMPVSIMEHYTSEAQSSGHLMLTRIDGAHASMRNQIIEYMGHHGIACNVHYKPLPMMTAYRAMGFDIADYPRAYEQFENEITLPFHTLLSDDDIDYVCATYRAALESCN